MLKIMIPTDAPTTTPGTANFWDATGIRYVTMYVDDAAGVADRCAAGGGTVVMPPFELRPGVTTTLLRDPQGNAVEVMQLD